MKRLWWVTTVVVIAMAGTVFAGKHPIQAKADPYVSVNLQKSVWKDSTGLVTYLSISILNLRKPPVKKTDKTKTVLRTKPRPTGPANIVGTVYAVYKHPGSGNYSIEKLSFTDAETRLGGKEGEGSQNGQSASKKKPAASVKIAMKGRWKKKFELRNVPGKKKLIDYVVSVHCDGKWIFWRSSSKAWEYPFANMKKTKPGAIVNHMFEPKKVAKKK